MEAVTPERNEPTMRRATLLSKVGQVLLVLGLVVADRHGIPGVVGVVDWALYGAGLSGLVILALWEQHKQARCRRLSLWLPIIHLLVAAALAGALLSLAPGLLPGMQLSFFAGWLFYAPAVVLIGSAGFLCHAPVARNLERWRRVLDRRLLATLLWEARARRKRGGEK